MTTLLLRASTINIPTSAGRKAWRRALAIATRHGDLTGAQEVFSPRAKALFVWLARHLGLRQFGLVYSPNPIFSDPDVWRRTRGNVHKLHGRGPLKYFRKWSGFNAARYATVAIYEHTNADAPLVTHLNTHLVPRGPKVPDWWRDQVRRISIEKITDIVAAHLAAGRVVLLTGDFNMEDAPKIPGVQWLWDDGVDKIGIAVPEGVDVARFIAHTFDAPVDHRHGVAAAITITY